MPRVVNILSVNVMITLLHSVPSRNLLIKKVDDDEIETVVYEPTGSVTDPDDDVRIFSIQLGVIRYSHAQLLVIRIGVGLLCSTLMLHMRGRNIN